MKKSNIKYQTKADSPQSPNRNNTNLSVSSNNKNKKRNSHFIKSPTKDDYSNIPKKKNTNSKLTSNEREEVKTSLTNHFLFKDKTPNIIYSLLRKIEIKKFDKNTIIFSEGGTGDYFYIIKEGSVEVSSENNNLIKILHRGNTFGELALLERKKRKETVKTLENTLLYQLDGKIFRNIVKTINKEELDDRLKFISIVPIFQNLENIKLNLLASSMFKCTFDEGQFVFYEGDLGDSVYIIKEGELECIKNNNVIRVLKQGEYFGEYAILFNSNRTLSCKAKNKLCVYKISNNLLEETLGNEYKDLILKSIIKEAFKHNENLNLFSENFYIDEIYPNTIIKLYEDNEKIIDKKDFNDSKIQERYLCVIICGNVITKNDTSNEIEIIGRRGQLLGEKFTKKKFQIENDIIAQGEVRLILIKWYIIEKMLNSRSNVLSYQNTIDILSQIHYLKKSQLFKSTSDNKLIKICRLMTKEKFKKGDIIFKEGEIGNKFYIIKKGKVSVYYLNKYVRELEIGNCFGETALLFNKKRSATIKVEENSTFYVLTKKDFNEIMDRNMLEYLKKKISLQDNFEMTLDDLYFCKNLGHGKFGIVSLVHDNKNFYAIKAVNKNLAEKQKILIKYFLEERQVLLQLDHPFIMKLVRTFKNTEHLFFLLEYINGKSLSKYLKQRKNEQLRNKSVTQFYISFLIIILHYLNSKKIIHRDLKPDNIMIDNNGYLKIIDFGTAVFIKNYTSTITGTAHYISPEILLGKGYSFSCDYWSVGIITHQIYYNFFPFGNDCSDPIDIYKEILRKELNLPLNGEESVNSFINCLLMKDIQKRVCNYENLRKHCFFKDFNWGDLIDFHLVPPYFPLMDNLGDFNKYNDKYLKVLGDLKKTHLTNNSLRPFDEDENLNFGNNWDQEF